MRVPLAILAAAILIPSPLVLAGTVRTESARYTGLPGDLMNDCGIATGGIVELGGACFATRHNREARIRLTADDDAARKTASMYIVFKGDTTYQEGFFCDTITLTLPDVAPPLQVYVYMQQAFAPTTCAGAIPATTGWIYAQFLTAA
ncbi:MAG TPA: hypothetical protein VI997_08765 [Candidatus Thermoplasmatota archaeon]|nr:hypothetical protein [Candidatus Thermoplasmatota archaeon]